MELEKATDIITDKVEQQACAKCGKTWDVSLQPTWSETVCPHCGLRQTVPAKLGHFL